MFDKPFEYQRLTLRVLHIDRYIGMKAGIGETLTGVLEGVTCEIIQ
jgi:preprotein translocase subunit SecA